MKEYVEAFFKELDNHPEYTKEQISKLKVRLCKEYSVKKIPTDIQLLLQAPSALARKYKKRLQTKPSRSLSGVAPVAIMSKPSKCPHGKCTMCPGGFDSPWGDKPQSYTGGEPATMRAERANYDSYLQVFNRLEQYMVTGHQADKIDLIIMGGTFPYQNKDYQDEFILYALKAMNDFSELFFSKGEFLLETFKTFFELPADIQKEGRKEHIQEKILKHKKISTLQDEQLRNESATIRCIGLTIETRPDWGYAQQGNTMLKQGATRVELGIQSVDDRALQAINRGHSVADNKKSIQELKDLGFKLNFHMMLGLPTGNADQGTKNRFSLQQELENLMQLFEDEDYRPDMLKLYPLMVMPGTLLAQDYRQGKFIPITTSESAQVIAQFLSQVPEYVRVMRVQRDIPTYRILDGVDKTNLRQYVDALMQKKGLHSNDIRARESGRNKPSTKPSLSITVTQYTASKGKEFFIAMQDLAQNTIAGFCRLRFPSQQLRKEITPTTALIRELHVYGASVSLGSEDSTSSQHKGFGKQLLKKAEEIAKEHGYDHLLVISGIGVKEYYRKLGYTNEGPYVGKKL